MPIPADEIRRVKAFHPSGSRRDVLLDRFDARGRREAKQRVGDPNPFLELGKLIFGRRPVNILNLHASDAVFRCNLK